MIYLLQCFVLTLTLLTLFSCVSVSNHPQFTLNITHMNDTHSHLEGTQINLNIGGIKTTVQLGGFARLQTLVNEIRENKPNNLILHAGDAVQGTLYFTLFGGVPEFDFLNRLGVDAMTFGNHEFDRGTSAIPTFLKRARFPFVSSNIDFSGEPTIAPLVKTYLIREIDSERIAVIGLTTETTPMTTINAGNTRFMDATSAARSMVLELEKAGVNKIILLSHLGYAEDLKLAASVNGIDVIVGGHSHTLLGEQSGMAELGLVPEGPYPAEVVTPDGGRTLVLQSWQWGHMLGQLQVSFDIYGVVDRYNAAATIPFGNVFIRDDVAVSPESPEYLKILRSLERSAVARVVREEPAAAAALAPYTEQLVSYRKTKLAEASEDLVRGLNSGPGPIGADSMLRAVPKAQLAILNYGGVRKDILAGPVTVGDVLEVMPFKNTLVLVDLSGEELKRALEEGIDFLLTRFPGRKSPALPYVSGVTFAVVPDAVKGSRVVSLAVKTAGGGYIPVIPAAIYRSVVSTFVANGGDGFASVKHAKGFRNDTGIVDSDALREYLYAVGTIKNQQEKRITVLNSITAVNNLPATSSADHYLDSGPVAGLGKKAGFID